MTTVVVARCIRISRVSFKTQQLRESHTVCRILCSRGACVEDAAATHAFVKEMLFRSLDARKLTSAYRMILELRKRYRARQQKEAEEADLVEQVRDVA